MSRVDCLNHCSLITHPSFPRRRRVRRSMKQQQQQQQQQQRDHLPPPISNSAMESPAAKRQSSVSQQQQQGRRVSESCDSYPPFSPHHGYRRQLSSYSVPSSDTSFSSTRSTGSFKAAAQGLAGVFGSCFVPRMQVKADQEQEVSQVSRKSHVSTDSAGTGKESTGLTVAELSKATSNFSEKNMVSQGASGSIYRGKLKDGSQVAIKRARKLEGRYLSGELSRELQALQKIEHQNLVRFLGFFEQKDETMIVVEYVSNGSLKEHLDESRGNGLELAQRLNIAIDVAHAITYLHQYAERAVIHRDIRSANVLLTDALVAKVTGLGMARVADADAEGSEATHITTQVKGTAGYLDPEYLGTYQLTDKSDVYSFGVLLIELVTGRPPIERRPGREPRATTKWALQKYRGGDAVVAMDPRMRRSPASVAAVERMLGLAEHCVAPARKDRPSMRWCTEELWTVRREYHRLQDASVASTVGDRSSESVSR